MKQSVEALFDIYTTRYMAYDAAGVAELCAAPFLAVREGVAIHLADANAVREHLATVMEGYRATGAAEAIPITIDVRPLGSHACTATVNWHVIAPDGRLLKDFATTYHLLAHGEGWRILSYTNHD